MKTLTLAALAFIAINLFGCTYASEMRCRKWQNEGRMVSSLDACTQCVNRLGSGNIEVIQGCAVGVDAALLLNENRVSVPRRSPY